MSLRANARSFDLTSGTVRDLNAALHQLDPNASHHWRILNPKGRHSIAAGLNADATVEIDGNVGYYCAGMNKRATVLIKGNAGVGVAENMMSGFVHVQGDASQSAGATANGGLLVIDGSAAARCAISLKGADVVVKGSIGHMSAFMAQAGSLAVLGDAGEALGDSIYEAKLFVRGSVHSLGADCIEKRLKDKHRERLHALLEKAGIAGQIDIGEFRRYGSARRLYHFHVDNASAY
jgi:methylamine---glutamate N-methyltransferase subunit B